MGSNNADNKKVVSKELKPLPMSKEEIEAREAEWEIMRDYYLEERAYQEAEWREVEYGNWH